jgi:prepilin-type N-terminal cleavage/methylation domain-containing protein/prepilin-type processing-associated H-X9-DG protein
MSHKTPYRKPSGFTLIELLVVIAIIAILASILFPVFARARENARRSSCSSNMKQIMLGVLQYVQDYDEKYPLRDTSTRSWTIFVQPYLKSEQIFHCPSDPNTVPNNSYQPFPLSYIGNAVTGNASVTVQGVFGRLSGATAYIVPMAAVQSPATTVLIADGAVLPTATAPYIDRTQARNNAYLMWTPGSTTATAAYGAPIDRHLDTVVVGWCDGHVKAQKIESFYTPATKNCMIPAYGCP